MSEASVRRMQQDRIADVYGGTTGAEVLAGYGLGWWISRDEPGVMADPGAYGSIPWLDLGRGYGAMIMIEGESSTGSAAFNRLRPILSAMFD